MFHNRYIGLSEVSADTLRRACKVEHIDAVQMEYSPFSMDIEDKSVGLLKACRELGVATIAYSPLGRGFLTGSITSRDDFEEGDWRLNAPRFSKDNFHKNLELVQGLQKIAEKKGCTPGQLTLAWLMAQGDDIIPIPGTTREKNLDENMGSLKVKLTKDEEAEIRKLIEEASIQGESSTICSVMIDTDRLPRRQISFSCRKVLVGGYRAVQGVNFTLRLEVQTQCRSPAESDGVIRPAQKQQGT